MTLFDNIKLLSKLKWNISHEHIEEFFNNFDNTSPELNRTFVTGLSEYLDPFFYYCGLCLTHNQIDTKLTPFLKDIENTNALLDAYLIMILTDNSFRHTLTPLIRKTLIDEQKIERDKIDSLLLFLIDNEDTIDTIGEVLAINNHYYRSELYFASGAAPELTIETENDITSIKHYTINIPLKFLKLDSPKSQNFLLYYTLNKSLSSSRLFDKANRELIIRSLNFNTRNLNDIDQVKYNLNPLFRNADEIIQHLGRDGAVPGFLSTFLNTKMSVDEKLLFLDTHCKQNLDHPYMSRKTFGSKLYFDTAYLSSQLNGIENMDFGKYPSYAQIVFGQILYNFTPQYDNGEARYDANFISYDYNRSADIDINSPTKLSNGASISNLRQMPILINDWKLLFKQITPLIRNYPKKNDILPITAKLLAKSQPKREDFLTTLTDIFGDYSQLIHKVNHEHFPDKAKLMDVLISGIANIHSYTSVIIEDFCSRGLFEQAGLVLKETRNSAHTIAYSATESIIKSMNDDHKASYDWAKYMMEQVQETIISPKTMNKTLQEHVDLAFQSISNLHYDDKSTQLKHTDANGNKLGHQYHYLFIKYPQLFNFSSSYIVGSIIADELSFELPNFPIETLIYHAPKLTLSFTLLHNVLKHSHRDTILEKLSFRNLLSTTLEHFDKFSEDDKNILYAFISKDRLRFLNSKSNLETLLKKDDWNDPKLAQNQVLFVEFLIQKEGSLDLFNSILEIAEFFEIKVSDIFTQNFYYLIDGALDNLFN